MSDPQIDSAAAAKTAEIYFNPWDPEFRANPYPHYRPLLVGPPRLIDLFGPAALVARYADVMAVLKDHGRFSSEQPPLPPDVQDLGVFGKARVMLFSDPPEHTRLRRLILKAFTPRRIREFEPRIREIMTSLLDSAAAKGELEVMGDVANALPVMVISQMLGVPPELYKTFKHWSDTIIASDNTLPGMPMPEEALRSTNDLRAYFTAAIEQRRQHPTDDLVGALVAARDENEAALTEGELLAFVILLLLAGNETTTNLIGNGMLALGRNPDQLALLRAKPGLMPQAVDEILRYDGPVQSTVRFVKEAGDISGTAVTPGMQLFVMVAAANRDPAQFENPEKFDITRQPNEHVAFGEGIHYCIGSALARLEGAIAIESMLARFPRLRLANPDAHLTYKGSYFLRGLAELRMAID
jgi:cytochrome P450